MRCGDQGYLLACSERSNVLGISKIRADNTLLATSAIVAFHEQISAIIKEVLCVLYLNV
jgi:hypothetical protein